MLDDVALRAPIDGEVLQVKVRPGELYSFQASEPLVVMGDMKPVPVETRSTTPDDERKAVSVVGTPVGLVTVTTIFLRRGSWSRASISLSVCSWSSQTTTSMSACAST